MRQQCILPRDTLPRHDRLSPRRQAPPAGPKGLVQDPPVLYLWQIEDAVGLALYVVHGDGREK